SGYAFLLPMLFPPGSDCLKGLTEIALRFPTRVFLELVVISHIEQLIAGAGTLQGVMNLLAGNGFDLVHDLKQRNRIAHAAANVVDLAGGLLETGAYFFKSIHEVMHAQNVSNLSPVAIDRDRPVFE